MTTGSAIMVGNGERADGRAPAHAVRDAGVEHHRDRDAHVIQGARHRQARPVWLREAMHMRAQSESQGYRAFSQSTAQRSSNDRQMMWQVHESSAAELHTACTAGNAGAEAK